MKRYIFLFTVLCLWLFHDIIVEQVVLCSFQAILGSGWDASVEETDLNLNRLEIKNLDLKKLVVSDQKESFLYFPHLVVSWNWDANQKKIVLKTDLNQAQLAMRNKNSLHKSKKKSSWERMLYEKLNEWIVWHLKVTDLELIIPLGVSDTEEHLQINGLWRISEKKQEKGRFVVNSSDYTDFKAEVELGSQEKGFSAHITAEKMPIRFFPKEWQKKLGLDINDSSHIDGVFSLNTVGDHQNIALDLNWGQSMSSLSASQCLSLERIQAACILPSLPYQKNLSVKEKWIDSLDQWGKENVFSKIIFELDCTASYLENDLQGNTKRYPVKIRMEKKRAEEIDLTFQEGKHLIKAACTFSEDNNKDSNALWKRKIAAFHAQVKEASNDHLAILNMYKDSFDEWEIEWECSQILAQDIKILDIYSLIPGVVPCRLNKGAIKNFSGKAHWGACSRIEHLACLATDLELQYGSMRIEGKKLELEYALNNHTLLVCEEGSIIFNHAINQLQVIKEIQGKVLCSGDKQEKIDIQWVMEGIISGKSHFTSGSRKNKMPSWKIEAFFKPEALSPYTSADIADMLSRFANHQIEAHIEGKIAEDEILWEGGLVLSVAHPLIPDVKSKGCLNLKMPLKQLRSDFPGEAALFVQSLAGASFKDIKGKIEFSSLSLNDWVNPILFSDGSIQILGLANVACWIDPGQLVFAYGVENFVLENTDCRVEVERLSTSSCLNAPLSSFEGLPLPSLHWIHFEQEESCGVIPIAKAKYFDKSTQLEFNDVQGQLFLKGKTLSLIDFSVVSENILFYADLDWDYRDPRKGVFELSVNVREIHGNLSDVQKFCLHFTQDALLNVPVKGQIDCQNQPAHLSLIGREVGMNIDLFVCGNLKKCAPLGQVWGCTIEEWDGEFIYQMPENRLQITNLSGGLNVPWNEGIRLDIEKTHCNVVFSDSRIFSFSAQASEMGNAVFQLQGNAIQNAQDAFAPVQFFIDSKTSTLFGMPLDECHVYLGQSPGDVSVQVKGNFDLKQFQEVFHQKLRLFQALIGPSRSALQRLLDKQLLQGNLKYGFQFKNKPLFWKFQLYSEDLIWYGQLLDPFGICLRSSASGIKADALMGSLILNGMVRSDQDGIILEPLNMRSPSFGNISTRVIVRPQEERIQLELKDVDLTLDGFNHIFQMALGSEKESVWKELKGRLKLGGELDFNFQAKDKCLGINGAIEIEAVSLAYKETVLGRLKGKAQMEINPSNLTFAEGEVALFPQMNEKHSVELPIQFLFKRAYLDKDKQGIDGCSFKVSGSIVPWLIETVRSVVDLSKWTRKKISIRDEYIQFLDPLADINGFFEMKMGESTEAKISLIQPQLCINGKDLGLEQVQFDFKNKKFVVHACHTIGNVPVWAHWQPKEDFGKMETIWLTDALQGYDNFNQNNSVSVHFFLFHNRTPEILSVQGKFAGIYLNLIKDIEDSVQDREEGIAWLRGEVFGDFSVLPQLIVEKGTQIPQWLQIGSGWHLKGKWKLDVRFPEKSTFSGSLNGTNFELCNKIFSQMESMLWICSENIQLEKVALFDPVGQVHIEKVELNLNKNHMYDIHIPVLDAAKIIPSYLKGKKGAVFDLNKNFEIYSAHIEDFKGYLNDIHSLTCMGELDFSTVKETAWSILNIPGDLWAHVGFSYSLLAPVSGKIHFQMKEGKIYLTNLIDAYSIGRRSRFYLDHTEKPSYISLNGELNIHLRMKQRNLILKLMDLLTLVIEGSIDKPVYSLQRSPIPALRKP